MLKNNKIACDVCGRFIAYSDLDRGLAKHELETPDSEYTSETYDSLCTKHYREEKDNFTMNYGLKQEWIFSPNKDCPKEILEELRNLWSSRDLYNGDYTGWECLEDRDEDDDFSIRCPILDQLLIQSGIQSCLIIW